MAGDDLRGEDVCDVLGKPVSLTVVYDTSGGNAVVTGQKSDKATSTGTPDNDGQSYIVVAKKDDVDAEDVADGKDIFFAGTVMEGQAFTASESAFDEDFGSNTVILVFDDEADFLAGANALQTIEYHTSCSQPIALGDQIGTLLLTGYEGEDGSDQRDFIPGVGFVGRDADEAPGPMALVGFQVDFTYLVTNEGGTALGNVTLADDRLSSLTFIGGDDDGDGLLDLSETFIFTASETAQLGLNTNTATVIGTPTDDDGTPLGLADVTDSDPANYTGVDVVPIEGDLCEELGKPVALVFEYDNDTSQGDKAKATGTPDDDDEAYIVVAKNDKVDANDVAEGKDIFVAGTVMDGDTLAVSEQAFGEDFGSDTHILVFDDEAAFLSGAGALQTMKYHTSCSKPIELFDQIGSLTLTGYEGEDGIFIA